MTTHTLFQISSLSRTLIFIFICALCLVYPSMGWAEVISYPTDGTTLAPSTPHVSDGNSLYPSITADSNNSVTVTGGTIAGHVYGGIIRTPGDTMSNTVTIGGGTIGHSVWGGYSDMTGNHSLNHTVNILGGAIGGSVYGGYVNNAVPRSASTASNNTVIMSGGTVKENIFGGYGYAGNAAVTFSNNRVFISNGAQVGGDVKGAYSSTSSVALDNNSVNISNAEIRGSVRGGDSTEGSAHFNTVTLTNSAVGGDVLGSHALTTSNNSSVTINGGSVSGNVHGGRGNSGTHSNSVTINNAKIDGTVYGGTANIGGATSRDNSVEIRGSTVGGDVFASRSGGIARNSSLTIADTAVVGTLYGNNNPSASWDTDNNSLKTAGNVSARGVQHFQYASITGGELNVTGPGTAAIAAARFQNLNNNGRLSFFNNTLDQLSGQVLGAYGGSGSIGLEVGLSTGNTGMDADRIEFATKPAGTVPFFFKPLTQPDLAAAPVRIASINNGAVDNAFTSVDPGYGIYAYKITRQGNDYFLSVDQQAIKELTKPYVAAGSAGVAQLAQSGAALMHRGSPISASVNQALVDGCGLAGGIGGAYENIDIGNGEMDVKGATGNLAMAWHGDTPFFAGLFLEMFDGSYDTRNNVRTSLGSWKIKGRGDLSSYGGGAFIQYRPRYAEAKDKSMRHIPGLHLEALARLGGSKSDFEDNSKNKLSFDVTRLYYGASIGAGYLFMIGENSTLDIYGNSIWTRVAKKEITDNLGQDVFFDDADSLQFASGVRFDYALSEKIFPYIGAGVDYEAMGKPDVYVDGFKGDRADLSGASGFAELGLFLRSDKNWSMDIKSFGSLGVRDGGGGSLNLRYEF